MSVSSTIRFSAWLLIILNLVMAFGSIWIFLRMAPAVERIIQQNSNSLRATEQMLVNIGLVDIDPKNADMYQLAFEQALLLVQGNITEDDEIRVIKTIRTQYDGAFTNKPEQRKITILAIQELGEINRKAMDRADVRARRIGSAGAWGIVVMASFVFGAGMLFLRRLQKNILDPVEEVQSVLDSHNKGETIRRCTTMNAPPEMHKIFADLNTVLDKASNATEIYKDWR